MLSHIGIALCLLALLAIASSAPTPILAAIDFRTKVLTYDELASDCAMSAIHTSLGNTRVYANYPDFVTKGRIEQYWNTSFNHAYNDWFKIFGIDGDGTDEGKIMEYLFAFGSVALNYAPRLENRTAFAAYYNSFLPAISPFLGSTAIDFSNKYNFVFIWPNNPFVNPFTTTHYDSPHGGFFAVRIDPITAAPRIVFEADGLDVATASVIGNTFFGEFFTGQETSGIGRPASAIPAFPAVDLNSGPFPYINQIRSYLPLLSVDNIVRIHTNGPYPVPNGDRLVIDTSITSDTMLTKLNAMLDAARALNSFSNKDINDFLDMFDDSDVVVCNSSLRAPIVGRQALLAYLTELTTGCWFLHMDALAYAVRDNIAHLALVWKWYRPSGFLQFEYAYWPSHLIFNLMPNGKFGLVVEFSPSAGKQLVKDTMAANPISCHPTFEQGSRRRRDDTWVDAFVHDMQSDSISKRADGTSVEEWHDEWLNSYAANNNVARASKRHVKPAIGKTIVKREFQPSELSFQHHLAQKLTQK